MSAGLLNISEIFHSIQGESSFAGWPCAFIRLAGCGHGCIGCDTAYAESNPKLIDTEEIIRQAIGFHAPCIEVTGGEPLLQPAVYPLMKRLCDLGHTVLLETGGFLSVAEVDQRVHKIIDLKPPSSGVSLKNNYENICIAQESLPPYRNTFEYKIVIAEKNDYEWAKSLLLKSRLTEYFTVMMGVAFGELEPVELAEWILSDRLKVRMQLQLHKYIWPPDMRGV
ncbi:MAG: radical SAM protein [Chlorobiales bacterium]|nr:radical SAM protein [Chlorobiales bacterium]